jgi:hypothetical protein
MFPYVPPYHQGDVLVTIEVLNRITSTISRLVHRFIFIIDDLQNVNKKLLRIVNY